MPPQPCSGTRYPIGRSTVYDNFCLVLGTVAHYTIREPYDFFGKYGGSFNTLLARAALSLCSVGDPPPLGEDLAAIPQSISEGNLGDTVPIAEVADATDTIDLQAFPSTLADTSCFLPAALAILQDPAFEQAHTIMLLTDSRKLDHPKVWGHFQHTAPLLADRTTIVGPAKEQWALFFANTADRDDRIHSVWAAVFLLECLIAAFPNKHYMLVDSDAVFTSLLEI